MQYVVNYIYLDICTWVWFYLTERPIANKVKYMIRLNHT